MGSSRVKHLVYQRHAAYLGRVGALILRSKYPWNSFWNMQSVFWMVNMGVFNLIRKKLPVSLSCVFFLHACNNIKTREGQRNKYLSKDWVRVIDVWKTVKISYIFCYLSLTLKYLRIYIATTLEIKRQSTYLEFILLLRIREFQTQY